MEAMISTMPGVNSSNELSSQYSVMPSLASVGEVLILADTSSTRMGDTQESPHLLRGERMGEGAWERVTGI